MKRLLALVIALTTIIILSASSSHAKQWGIDSNWVLELTTRRVLDL